MSDGFPDVKRLLAALRPDDPVFVLRPHELRRAAQDFTGQFFGDTFYAVRVNRRPECLEALYAGGIRHFAVSSLAELRAVKSLFPDAPCHFTHPVKSATAIREAAHQYGVTHFTADHAEELAKIIAHAMPVKPVITVRLAVPADNGD